MRADAEILETSLTGTQVFRLGGESLPAPLGLTH